MVKSRVLKRFEKKTHQHQQCISQAMAAAEAKCAQDDVRLTPTRRRVLELIWGSHLPSKAYDILDKLRNENRRAAPPTVYRALEFLVEEGLVHRIESLNAYVGCGEPGQAHAGQFLICRACGNVAELDDPEVSEILASTAEQAGFQVARETVEMEGLCVQCSNEPSRADDSLPGRAC